MSWRDTAAPIIARVLQETKGLPDKEVRAALRAAYPFGERRMHPYKIWCDEVRRQMKLPRQPRKAGNPHPADGSLTELHDQAVLSFLEERRKP